MTPAPRDPAAAAIISRHLDGNDRLRAAVERSCPATFAVWSRLRRGLRVRQARIAGPLERWYLRARPGAGVGDPP